MKTRVFFFLAAAALLAGCAKEIQAPVEDQTVVSGPITLQVGINNPKDDLEVEPTQAPTRTVLGAKVGDAYPVYWSNGDKIQINDKTSDALTEVAASTSSTSFNFSEAPTAPYNVLYPASIYKDASHVTLPAVQTYKAGGFADEMFPMAGYSADGSNITINHLCAIVKVSVKRSADPGADTDNIAAVRFKGHASEKVSGNFEIDYSTPALAAATGTGAELEVRVVKSLATSTSEAVVYYLVVPARAYASGFDIIVTDANNDIMTKTKSSAVTLVAGKMYSMTEFAFEPSGTDTGIEIASAEDLIAFAEAYNNGDYADYGSTLVATLTANITFDATSSAAFNTTGGIGTPYGGINYFKGVFNGNNKTISALTSTVPLFGGIDSGSIVKDLTLDEKCSFTFTRPTADAKYYGAIAGYHKGTISGVSVAADVSLAAVSGVSGETGFGGLVGRLADNGTIDGCTYSGDLVVPSGFVTSANDVYIRVGGIVGISLATTTSVIDSHMRGTIDYAAVLTAPTANNTTPYVTLGGIIGQNKGTVTNCDTACLDDDSDGAISYNASNGNTYYATIVNHSTQTHCLAEGGIVGYNYGGGAVSSCVNRAKIITNIIGSGANSDAVNYSARYFRIGGIAGMSSASTVTGCDNYGEIVNSSTARIQVLGGIVGLNYGVGELSACNNYSSGTIDFIATGAKLTTDGDIDVRSPYCGGIIGTNQSSTVSDIHNYADLTISCIESDVTNYDVDLGGIIGHNESAIDGGGSKDITNSGRLYASFSATGATAIGQGIDLGGIAGSSSASVENAVNTGYVHFYGISATTVLQKIFVGGIVGRMTASGSVNGCINKNDGGTNDGEVYFHFDNNATKHTDNYAGGILGYSSYGVSITDCTNGGYIHAGNGSTAKSPATCFVGGIVAYLSGSGSEISDCTNTGNVYCHHRNNSYNGKNNSTYTGGIAGEVVGTSDNRISIDNCIVNPAGNVSSHRGWVGGVVGYAEYADISSCTHNKDFGKDNTSAYFVGGIVGWALNCELSSCSWSGTTIDSSQLQANGGAGIVAQMDGGSLDNCSSYVTTIQKSSANVAGGALIGIALNTPTVKNCHYKANVNGAAANLASTGTFTDGGGNVADL